MSKISIYDIARILIEKNGLTKSEAEQFVAAAFDIIQEGLERDSLVKVKGLGTFKIIGVEARESVNVNTGERVLIESHGKVTFTPDSVMKELVNKPFSQFETVVLNDGIEFDDISDERSAVVSDNDITEGETSKPYNTTELPENEEAEDNPVQDAITEVQQEEINEHDTESDEHVSKEDEKEAEELLHEENIIKNEPQRKDVIQDIPATYESDEHADTPAYSESSADTADASHSGSDEEEVAGKDTATDVKTEMVPVNDEVHTENHSRNNRIWLWILLAVAFVILVPLSFYGGYKYGLDSAVLPEAKPKVIVKRIIVNVSDSLNRQNTDKQSEQSDSTAANSNDDKNAKSESVKAENVSVANEENVDFEKYAAKDARVRTGAYRIVGTDRVWTVGKGETLAGISRRLLGEGMSCYIEVYNDLTAKSELKEGQQIKIPKLKLKRKSNN